MLRSMTLRVISAAVAGGLLIGTAGVSAQSTGASLGSVRVPRPVVANGEPLAAGTYVLRLTGDSPAPVKGQTLAESRWVEFVQDGHVRGREVATVLSGAEARTVLQDARPASGASRTDVLKGGDYLRIWVNRGDTQYLVHLPIK